MTPPAHVAVTAADAVQREELAAALDRAFEVVARTLGEISCAVQQEGVVAIVAIARTPEDVVSIERARAATLPLVLLTAGLADASIAEALERLEPVAWLPHPAPAPALAWAVGRAVGRAAATTPAERRRTPILIGRSEAMQSVTEAVRRLAPTEMPVLVLGETGTGKELVARAIHEASRRAGGPFVALNCAALPDSLLESELFGFVRGSFTGAERDKQGLFEQAHGGTLFLDEIGDMPPVMQAKLLRVLEARCVRPLGAAHERPVDVRIVTATHRDLDADAAAGRFRLDLLYRLDGARVQVPPLRRRREDIPMLVAHLAAELGATRARRVTLADDALEALERHPFRGNVRELRNAIERAIATTAPHRAISAADLGLVCEPATIERDDDTLRGHVERLESSLIRAALVRFGGNRTHVARALGLSRLGLREKMRRLGIADTVEGR